MFGLKTKKILILLKLTEKNKTKKIGKTIIFIENQY